MVFHFRPKRVPTRLKLSETARKQLRNTKQPSGALQNWWNTRDADIAKSGIIGFHETWIFDILHSVFWCCMKTVWGPKTLVFGQKRSQPTPETVSKTKRKTKHRYPKYRNCNYFNVGFSHFPSILLADEGPHSKSARMCLISRYITSDFFSRLVQTFL